MSNAHYLVCNYGPASVHITHTAIIVISANEVMFYAFVRLSARITSLKTNFGEIFGRAGCLNGNKSFDSRADHDQNSGMF